MTIELITQAREDYFSRRHKSEETLAAHNAFDAGYRAALEAQQAGGEPAKFQAIYFRRGAGGVDRLIIPASEDPAEHIDPVRITNVELLYTRSAPVQQAGLIHPKDCLSRRNERPQCPAFAPVQQVDALLPDVDAYRAKYAEVLTLTDDMCYGYECAREELRAALAAQPAAEWVAVLRADVEKLRKLTNFNTSALAAQVSQMASEWLTNTGGKESGNG